MMEDFTRAITEIKPAFGVSVDQLEASMPNGLLHYGPRFTRMFETGLKFISQVKESEKTPLLSVLLEVSPSLLSPLAPSLPRGLSPPLALLLSFLREVSSLNLVSLLPKCWVPVLQAGKLKARAMCWCVYRVCSLSALLLSCNAPLKGSFLL
jgi:hypothetical protein